MKFTFQKGHFYDQISHLFTSFTRYRPPLMRLLFVDVLLWGYGQDLGYPVDNKENYNPDINSDDISIIKNKPNDVPIKDMIGINESGYVFWDNVYKTWASTTPPTIVNLTVANSFKSAFHNIRIFV